MNGSGKSDRPVGTEEPFEQGQVRVLPEEKGEGRGLTKENQLQQNKYRTLGRVRVGYGEP
jgi:hypothetical protein